MNHPLQIQQNRSFLLGILYARLLRSLQIAIFSNLEFFGG